MPLSDYDKTLITFYLTAARRDVLEVGLGLATPLAILNIDPGWWLALGVNPGWAHRLGSSLLLVAVLWMAMRLASLARRLKRISIADLALCRVRHQSNGAMVSIVSGHLTR
jgi:hypothetical protein